MRYRGSCAVKAKGWKRWQAIADALSDTVADAENLKPCIEELVADCPGDLSHTLEVEADNLRRVANFIEKQAEKSKKEKPRAHF